MRIDEKLPTNELLDEIEDRAVYASASSHSTEEDLAAAVLGLVTIARRSEARKAGMVEALGDLIIDERDEAFQQGFAESAQRSNEARPEQATIALVVAWLRGKQRHTGWTIRNLALDLESGAWFDDATRTGSVER